MLEIRKILVPVDFSACSKAAVEYALDLAALANARVDLLHAWTLPASLTTLGAQLSTGSGDTLEGLAQKEATRQMNEFASGIARERGTAVGGVSVKFGSEADVILESAREYDLVVMGTHGRTGISHLVLGSIAEKVVRRASCPVLTVRGPAS